MLILSTLEVFFTWVVVAIILIGLGSLLLSRFTNDFFATDAFWMGLAVSVAVLEIWNLILPITASTTLILSCAGILGLALNSSSLLTSWRVAWQSSRWLFLLGTAFTLLLALRSCGPCEYSDTGLYGAPAIRWLQTYPAVPGLANLHGRFGYNSSVFLCIAALGQGIWRDLGFHLFTGFLISALWASLLPAFARIVGKSSTSPADWFHCILAVPAFFWTTRSRIVGTQTDEPAAIVALIAAGIFFEHLCWTDGEDQRNPGLSRLLVAAALFALAVAFKLSTIVLVAGPISKPTPQAPFRRAGTINSDPASLVRPRDYLERLSFFPSHRFRFPCSVDSPPLRREVVRPRRSILGTHPRRSLSRDPRSPLAR
jgi:hypothetical protein